MSLEAEVDENRKAIRTDGYPMSIGELAAMYRDNEIELHPEFQRFFRWSPQQKSRLIESLLLGIPIPSVFVHQRADGVWDVVDGLQRLSAIFESMGILQDDNGRTLPPLTLAATKYLPSLDGRVWGTNEADPNGLGGSLQRVLKRAKLDIKIVLRESDADTKLELFQRLNTGGSPLSTQELRNCQILMVNPNTLEQLKDLARLPEFQSCIALSDRNLDEQYDLELVVRFVVMRRGNIEGIGDLGPFLDAEIIKIAANDNFDWTHEAEVFRRTFCSIEQSLGEDAFRRYDGRKDRFLGGFLVSVYEVLALGIGYHFDDPEYEVPDILDRAKSLWTQNDIVQTMKGRRAGDRLRTTLTFGRSHMAYEKTT